jgi:hypothetical protein
MATQTLEFNAGSGLTLSCKVFALNSDTVVDTQTATEQTNDKNRYRVAFTDLPAGAYRLNAFVGAVGGFANEVYDVTLSTATFYPRSEDSTLGGKIIGTLAAGTHTAQTGDAFARLGAPAGASIAEDIANIDGGSGLTGPNTVTITVTDGTNPIEDATVRIHRTGYSETKKTNASGVVSFTVTSANWSVSISATGYASETNALTVDGDETVSYSLDAFAVSEPSAPNACVVQCFIYENASPIQNATVKARLRDINSAVNGVVLTKNTVEATTNANGYAELELLRSSAFSDGSGKYVIEVWSQSKNVWAITATIPDQDTVNLEDLLS